MKVWETTTFPGGMSNYEEGCKSVGYVRGLALKSREAKYYGND